MLMKFLLSFKLFLYVRKQTKCCQLVNCGTFKFKGTFTKTATYHKLHSIVFMATAMKLSLC